MRRIVIFAVVICLMMSGCLGRIGYISFNKSDYAEEGKNSVIITLDINEINLFYRDMKKITNNRTEKIAVIKPETGKPYVTKNISSNNALFYNVTISDYNCKQLIEKSSSGLLKHIKDSDSKLKLRFSVDARGRILSGDKGELISENYYKNSGIVLTLDDEVQNVLYESCSKLKSGCAVIMDVKSSEILACVTKPDSSFINKPFSQFSAGSVFKIVTALCALDNNLDPVFNCKGKIKLGDTEISCQKNKKHGKQNLCAALENSCNCYFVNLSQLLEADKILLTAKRFGFGETNKLYNGWYFKNAVLPGNYVKLSKGETALLSFGQGDLTVTPVQICNLLCTIANGGIYNKPKLIKEEIDEELNVINYEADKSKQVINNSDADIILNYLRKVVENGTGKKADFNNKSAGKTATAQTGQYVNGKEILNTWFAGVYPYDNPKYAIVIMCDNGTSGAGDCCPIFKNTVEKLMS